MRKVRDKQKRGVNGPSRPTLGRAVAVWGMRMWLEWTAALRMMPRGDGSLVPAQSLRRRDGAVNAGPTRTIDAQGAAVPSLLGLSQRPRGQRTMRARRTTSRRILLAGLLMVIALILGGLSLAGPRVHLLTAVTGSPNAATIAQARAKIKHVVFVLLENHSFDNIFGRFPGVDGATTAHSGNQTIPLLHAPPVYWHDIYHDYVAGYAAIDSGKMDGFSKEHGADLNGDRMAYQQYT